MRKTNGRIGSVAVTLTAAVFALTACAGPTPTPDAQPAPDGLVMTTANIAGIATTVNTGEVELGQLALERSRNSAVRQFAQRMVTEHHNLDQRVRAVTHNLGATPGTNQVTQQLERTVRDTKASLRDAEGASFDRTYMRSQIDLHEWALQTLDDTLIPSARSGELRDVLLDMRASVANHLNQARQIHASL